jgi:predicted phage gp36 major capsid-like protein
MAYNSLIDRTGAAALIPEVASREILQTMADTSWLLSLARRLPNMSTAQTRLPVLSTLPVAYFVTGDTGLKQTTEVAWDNKYIDAEEVAVIVPIPQAVLDDADYDIWAEIRPLIAAAFNKAITGAVFFGTNIPSTWTVNLGAAGLVAAILAASHDVSAAGFTDIYEAIMGESSEGAGDGVLALVEADGYTPTGHVAYSGFKATLRNVRSADGVPIFNADPGSKAGYTLDGTPCVFPADGSLSSTYKLITGQWDQLVYAMRQDITYRMLTEGVISDAGGNIVYNLPQQDMVALRATMRIGFALPNPINPMNETEATRCPFAYLTA